MFWLGELEEAVCRGEEALAERITTQALAAGITPRELLERGAVAGIYRAGRLWEEGEFFLPDIILATEAFKEVMKRLEPLLKGGEFGGKGKVVIGSVEGDAHDIGKNIVATFLRCASYEVVDLGIDVPHGRFVEELCARGADVLGLGAYMTTTMRGMEEVMCLLDEAGLRERVKVIVGGAAVTPDYAERIGADGYGENAAEAVKLVDRLLGVI